jgi:hypothetical protein
MLESIYNQRYTEKNKIKKTTKLFFFLVLTSPPGSGVAPNLALRLAISTVGPTKRLVPESAILF